MRRTFLFLITGMDLYLLFKLKKNNRMQFVLANRKK